MFKLGRWWLGLPLIVSLLLALSLSYQVSEAEAPTTILSQLGTQEYLTIQNLEDAIDVICEENNFPYFSLMKNIASCESSYRHFSDGGVLKGVVNSKDVGLFQINENLWSGKAMELGYDIYEVEGNIRMAVWLAKSDYNGFNNWKASEPCWKK